MLGASEIRRSALSAISTDRPVWSVTRRAEWEEEARLKSTRIRPTVRASLPPRLQRQGECAASRRRRTKLGRECLRFIGKSQKAKAPRTLIEGGAASTHSFSRRVRGQARVHPLTDSAMIAQAGFLTRGIPCGPASPSRPGVPGQWLRPRFRIGRICKAHRSQWRDRGRISRPSLFAPQYLRHLDCF